MTDTSKEQPSLEQIQNLFTRFQEQQKNGLSPIDQALWELGVTVPEEWKARKEQE